MPLCGAKTRGARGGKPCKNSGMPNGRCRLHGGKSTGAPPGNKNAVIHGIYAEGLRADERPLWHEITLGTVDDEIKLLKFQLRRCLVAQRLGEESPTDAQLLEITEIADKTETSLSSAGDAKAAVPVETKTRSITRHRPDYRALIQRLTGLISTLELRRQRLLQKPVGSTEPVTLDDARDHALALVEQVARRTARKTAA